QVDRDPFRITVVRDGTTVVSESEPGRLRYRLRSGAEHALTKDVSSRGNAYEVATDEPGRTATVTTRRIRHGFRIAVRLRPAPGVVAVYDAFDASADDHYLGG